MLCEEAISLQAIIELMVVGSRVGVLVPFEHIRLTEEFEDRSKLIKDMGLPVVRPCPSTNHRPYCLGNSVGPISISPGPIRPDTGEPR